MTFDQLQAKCDYTTLDPKDWHQHPNGGGWIYKDAFIEDNPEIYIGPKAIVWGGTIREKAHITGGEMWGGVMRGGEMRGGEMRGGVMRGGEMRGGVMWGGVMWGGVMWGGEMWGGEMRGGVMLDGKWETNPLFVSGSRHPCSNAKPGYIQIGCKLETFEWWKSEEAAKFARSQGYSKAEQAEYAAYIELFIKFGK